MAEDYYSTSPYAYVENNPIGFVDPTGMYKVDANGNITFTNENEIESFLYYQNSNPNSGYRDAYQYVTNAENGFKLELEPVQATGDGQWIENVQAQQSVMASAISIGVVTGSILGPLDGPLPIAEVTGFAMGVLATYAAVKSAELGIAISSSASMAYGVPSMSETNGLVLVNQVVKMNVMVMVVGQKARLKGNCKN